jgi:DNA-directed RNA polymerase I subunit RPA12
MGWPFCDSCGTILDPPKGKTIECTLCQAKYDYTRLNVSDVVTTSATKDVPDWALDDSVSLEESGAVKHATIEETCPQCGHQEMYFYTMQLRSVDEGQTVFYECTKCKYKYSVNN